MATTKVSRFYEGVVPQKVFSIGGVTYQIMNPVRDSPCVYPDQKVSRPRGKRVIFPLIPRGAVAFSWCNVCIDGNDQWLWPSLQCPDIVKVCWDCRVKEVGYLKYLERLRQRSYSWWIANRFNEVVENKLDDQELKIWKHAVAVQRRRERRYRVTFEVTPRDPYHNRFGLLEEELVDEEEIPFPHPMLAEDGWKCKQRAPSRLLRLRVSLNTPPKAFPEGYMKEIDDLRLECALFPRKEEYIAYLHRDKTLVEKLKLLIEVYRDMRETGHGPVKCAVRAARTCMWHLTASPLKRLAYTWRIYEAAHDRWTDRCESNILAYLNTSYSPRAINPILMQPQGPFSIKDFFKNQTSSVVNDVTNDITEKVVEKVYEAIEEVKDQLPSGFDLDDYKKSLINNAISNLVHSLISPKPATIAWSICSLLVQIGIITASAVSNLVKAVTLLWQKLFSYKPPSEDGTEMQPLIQMTPQSDTVLAETQELCSGVIGLLFAGICSTLSIVTSPPKDLCSLSKFLVKDLGSISRSATCIMTFVKNVFSVVVKIIHYCVGLKDVRYRHKKLLESNLPFVKKWLDEVLILTDPGYQDQHMSKALFHDRVYNASIIGNSIMSALGEQFKSDDANPHIVVKMYERLTTLREKLIAQGKHPAVRKECYPIWLYGSPGIGKSFLVNSLSSTLLQSVNYVTSKDLVCTVNPLDKYWTLCNGQPVLLVDDMFSVESPEALNQQLCLMFMVVTNAVLCPPMADLADKKMRYNPELFFVCSNKAFMNLACVDADAVHRRRRALIEAVVNDEPKPGCVHCEKKLKPDDANPVDLEDFHHLKFRLHSDPKCPTAPWGSWMNYSELVDYLKKDYVGWYQRETVRYNKRLTTTYSLDIGHSSTMFGIDGHSITRDALQQAFDLYKRQESALFENKTAVLSRYIDSMRDKLEDRYVQCTEWLRRLNLKQFSVPNLLPQMDPEDLLNPFFGSDPDEILADDDDLIAYPVQNDLVNALSKARRDVDSVEIKSFVGFLTPFASAYTNLMNEEYNEGKAFISAILEQFKEVIENNSDPDSVDLTKIYKCTEIYEPFWKEIIAFLYDVLTPTQFLSFLAFLYAYLVEISEGFVNIDIMRAIQQDQFIKILHMTALRCTSRLTLKLTKYTRYWYEIFGMMSSVTRCGHVKGDLENIYYDPATDNFLRGGSFLTCGRNCASQNKALYRLFLLNWIMKHSWVRTLYLTGSNSRSIPTDLRLLRDGVIRGNGEPSMILIRDEITKWFANISQYIKTAYEFASDVVSSAVAFVIKYSALILRIVAGIGIFLSSIYYFTHTISPTPVCQAISQPSTSTTPMAFGHPQSLTAYSSPSHVKLHQPIQTRVLAQGAIQQLEVVRERINQNSVFIKALYGTKTLSVRCLLLRSRTLLVLRHYIEEFRQLPENTEFFVEYVYDHEKRVGNKIPIRFDIHNVEFSWVTSVDPTSVAASNIGVCQLPPQFPEAKDLVKFIAPKNAHTHSGSVGTLCYTGQKTFEMVTIKLQTAMFEVMQGSYSSSIPMEQVYTYRYQGYGMCGSVLLSNSLQYPIIGIHVAGVEGENGFGAAEPIYRELFDPLDEVTPYNDVVIPELLSIDLAKINLETAVYPLGCESPTRAFNQGAISGEIPSLIHGVFPVRTEPNPLGPRDPRLPPNSSPLKLGVEKHGLPPLEFPVRWVNRATQDLSDKLNSVVLPIRNTVSKISLQESICGNSEIEGFQPLDWSTSEGFPLNTMRPTGHTGKRWLFSLEETPNGLRLIGLEKELLRLLSLWESLYKKRIRPYTVFIDCLKDTCLPVEKCKIPGKTRIFSISPVQFTILFKQYFLDFMASYQKARFEAEHGIGMDVNSMEWTQLAMRIQSKGPKIIAGDYSNFGPALSSQVATAAASIILDWYLAQNASVEDQQIRKIMLEEILHAYHLCNNVIYQTPCGIPSGSPITAPLNSIVNCLYIRIAWLGIFEGSIYDDFRAFNEHVVLVTYGDDIIMNVSNEVIDRFNTQTLSDFFARYNIKFTDADKSDNIVLYRSLDTATFLKCHFVKHPFRPCFLASLDPVSVEGTVNWIKRKGNKVENTLACVDAGINLAYGRGKQYFDWYRKTLIQALARIRLCPTLLTWEEIDTRIFSEVTVICMVPQMERIGAEGDVTGATADQASNVVLTEVRTESEDQAAPVIKSNFKLCSSDTVTRIGTLTDRWLLFKTFEWNKNSVVNTSLFNYLLPYEFVKSAESSSICDVPNLMPFRVHRYFKGDMEVKIQVNSNKFQVGSLMLAWWYEPDADGMFAARQHIYSASQTSHVIVNASASNEASFSIPFRYHLPVLHTKPRDDLSTPLNMGRLLCFVLNPLTVADGGPDYCTGAVFIKFTNCEFSGMMSGNIDPIEDTKDSNKIEMTPQMDLFTMEGAMKLINTACEVANRDNPPQVLPPSYIVPTASHSWAVGTGASEPLHPLRLDNRGQVRHPSFCPADDAMTVNSIARNYGLVKTLTWSKDDPVGHNLFTVDAAPMWKTSDYQSVTLDIFKDWLTMRALPPVAIMSSLFSYWRGSLEFKFDIVASQFHTGKLMIGYIPGVDRDKLSSVSNSVLRCSPHVVFTLQENQSFTFKIPFIANKPWWHRYYSGNNPDSEVKPPSCLYVNVLNRLIPMQSVPQSIYINVYVRAGEDFEVAIPAQPCVGLWWNAKAVYPTSLKVRPATGYSPYYGGTWHAFAGGNHMVFRWGTASDQIAQFVGVLDNTDTYAYYYTLDDVTNAVTFPGESDGKDSLKNTIMVAFYASWHGFFIGIPVKSVDYAEKLLTLLFRDKKSPADASAYLLSTTNYKPSNYTPDKVIPTWSPVKYTFTKVSTINMTEENNFVLVSQGERTDNLQILSPTDDLLTTQFGALHFGENFSNLKDLGRRYQLYSILPLQNYTKNPLGSISVIVPILPQGLRLDVGTSDSIHEVANRSRDGHIPIIASGYRYYRGSLRIRLVFPFGKDVAVWVQHRPDKRLAALSPIFFSGVTSGRMLINHGYASYYQLTDINPVIELEIPFYQPGSYGFLQVPKIVNTEEGFYYSLGELAIGFTVPMDLSKQYLLVFYALGDDMAFNTFQGYGPVCILDEIVSKKD